MPGSSGEHELQDRYGTQRRAQVFYEKQVLDHLNEEMQAFIADMEMVFVATSDSTGEADCSFRAGPAGFVRALDEWTLAYPEYRGNGVMASLGNMAENPHVGLLFVDFFGSTIGLHVNGTARTVENDRMGGVPSASGVIQFEAVDNGPKPERWVVVEVDEAYIHCSKHIPLMAKLDKSITWGTDDTVRKGGDYFNAGASRVHESAGAAAER